MTQTPDPSAPDSTALDASTRKRPWRDNIEAMTMAIVMAVMLKYFVVEAYKIPTGSMQPTLMGNEDTGIFDRILVDKLSFHLRDPERFEIVVFKYPLDRSKNFIKRLVGMPGEHFRIAEGDLWTVAITGGLAHRLTTHPAEETDPVISPDGKTLAFTARYEGQTALYTMPVAGGATLVMVGGVAVGVHVTFRLAKFAPWFA